MSNEKASISPKPQSPELKVVADLLDVCTSHGFFSSGFDVLEFGKKCEFRGLRGEYWDDAKLDLVIARLKRQIIADEKTEEDIDKILQTLAAKIGIEINQLRQIFYGIKLSNPEVKEK